jgi:hypothetical protein
MAVRACDLFCLGITFSAESQVGVPNRFDSSIGWFKRWTSGCVSDSFSCRACESRLLNLTPISTASVPLLRRQASPPAVRVVGDDTSPVWRAPIRMCAALPDAPGLVTVDPDGRTHVLDPSRIGTIPNAPMPAEAAEPTLLPFSLIGCKHCTRETGAREDHVVCCSRLARHQWAMAKLPPRQQVRVAIAGDGNIMCHLHLVF